MGKKLTLPQPQSLICNKKLQSFCDLQFFCLNQVTSLHLFVFCDMISKFGEIMQKLELTKSLSLTQHSGDEYIENHKAINDALLKISNGFEKDYIDNLNGDIFINNKNISIFVLKQNRTPIAFAVVGIKNKNAQVEMICTANDYQHLGYATILLRALAVRLLNNGVKFLSVEHQQNEIVKNLVSSFSKIEDVLVAEETEKYFTFDISGINENKIIEDIKKIAF